MKKNPGERLAGEMIKDDLFFDRLDWEQFENGAVEPPFVPEQNDYGNFDPFYTKKDVKLSKIKMDENETNICDDRLDDFDYYEGF